MSTEPSNAAGVSYIDLGARLVYLRSGEVVPITNLVNREHDNVDDPRLAYGVVAGPRRDGGWVCASIDNDDRVLSGYPPQPTAVRVDRAAGTVELSDGRVLPAEAWLGIDEQTVVPAGVAYFAVVDVGMGRVADGHLVLLVRLEESDELEVV